MFYFCKYKDALGKPKEGVHKYRIMNLSIFDVLATILLAKTIQYYIDIMFYIGYNFTQNILCKNNNR